MATKSSNKCKTCDIEMNMPGFPSTNDCGGDCTLCMAESGDPDAITSIIGEFRLRRDNSAIVHYDRSKEGGYDN